MMIVSHGDHEKSFVAINLSSVSTIVRKQFLISMSTLIVDLLIILSYGSIQNCYIVERQCEDVIIIIIVDLWGYFRMI